MKNLTRRDIARRVQDEVGSQVEARRFTDVFFETLGEMVANNDKTQIHRFGVFRQIRKRARVGRNPKTGEAALVTARRVVNFTASPLFKERLADHDRNR